MKRGLSGTYSTDLTSGEAVNAFIPKELPPEPKIEWVPDLARLHEQGIAAIGRLDGVLPMLPDSTLFLYSYVRKEALLSSQIEGTQSSLTDLFAYEAGEDHGFNFDDVKEVSNYVLAMEHGVRRLREGFPISNRLLCEVHQILLSSGRGENKHPGEFRKSQNWIGGTRPGNAHFVPPPHLAVPECMAALERFIHDDPRWTSTIVKAALAHLQFETIHPFEDGNGRVGRLLITLILCSEGFLREPLLYLSLYLKENRSRYYELLQKVRMEGDWEEWLQFFFTGVAASANEAALTAQALLKLFAVDRNQIQELGHRGSTALQVHHEFQRTPLLTVGQLIKRVKLTAPTVHKAVGKLVSLGIIAESTGRKRDRLFVYSKYLARLQEGTAPL